MLRRIVARVIQLKCWSRKVGKITETPKLMPFSKFRPSQNVFASAWQKNCRTLAWMYIHEKKCKFRPNDAKLHVWTSHPVLSRHKTHFGWFLLQKHRYLPKTGFNSFQILHSYRYVAKWFFNEFFKVFGETGSVQMPSVLSATYLITA